jgi:hypothetical protein
VRGRRGSDLPWSRQVARAVNRGLPPRPPNTRGGPFAVARVRALWAGIERDPHSVTGTPGLGSPGRSASRGGGYEQRRSVLRRSLPLRVLGSCVVAGDQTSLQLIVARSVKRGLPPRIPDTSGGPFAGARVRAFCVGIERDPHSSSWHAGYRIERDAPPWRSAAGWGSRCGCPEPQTAGAGRERRS